MKKLFFVFLLLSPSLIFAQFEVGLLAGLSAYHGEIAPETSRASFSQSHASFGAFVRNGFSKHFTLRAHFMYGKISGEDSYANNQSRINRNLGFRSRIYEGALIGEFNILGYRAYNFERVFSPYLFAGVGFFNFNPEAFYDNEWVKLQPLGTEGQSMVGFEDNYRLWELSIPMGIGVKYAINDRWNVGFEFGLRKTFTDYLDDISTVYVNYDELLAGNGELAAALGNRTAELTGGEPVRVETGSPRGNADNDDWYFITGFTVSYNFSDNGLVGSRRKSRRRGGCNY